MFVRKVAIAVAAQLLCTCTAKKEDLASISDVCDSAERDRPCYLKSSLETQTLQLAVSRKPKTQRKTASTATATVGAYPGAADAGVTGTVSVTADAASLTISGTLSGLEVSATGGFHIHSGYSCDDATIVGGHWWNSTSLPDADPWFTTYTSDGAGSTSLSITITAAELGYDPTTMVGHTVVVHESSGGRVACGVLGDTASAIATVGTYPGATDAGVTGTVSVSASTGGLTIWGTLSGLEVSATGGFHIHSGFSCDDATLVGGHWWNSTSLPDADPWFTTYTSDGAGAASLSITITTAELGYDPTTMVGHTVVVHESSGGRVACGVLGTSPTPSPVHAVGDPHITNVLGQRFDLLQPGKHVFLLIPRSSHAQDTLLRVDVDVNHVGSACSDMYIQSLNITGKWADEQGTGGFSYYAEKDAGRKGTNWMHFGRADLKVVWGRTIEGVKYLNIFARKLGQTGVPVGGLLGEDDHTIASTPDPSCKHTDVLFQMQAGESQAKSQEAHGGSTAEASLS